MPRKRRSLLGAPDGQVPSVEASASAAAPESRERTTPVTEAIQRRSEPGAPPRPPAPTPEPPAGSLATPPTTDRPSVGGGWFLATGQSPPERTASGEEPAVKTGPRNPWLWVAPIAGIAAVGLLFVMALVAALAFL